MNNQCIVNALTTQNKNCQSIDRDVPYFPSLDLLLETERPLRAYPKIILLYITIQQPKHTNAK